MILNGWSKENLSMHLMCSSFSNFQIKVFNLSRIEQWMHFHFSSPRFGGSMFRRVNCSKRHSTCQINFRHVGQTSACGPSVSILSQDIPHPGIYLTLAAVFTEHNSEKDFSIWSEANWLTASRAQRVTNLFGRPRNLCKVSLSFLLVFPPFFIFPNFSRIPFSLFKNLTAWIRLFNHLL